MSAALDTGTAMNVCLQGDCRDVMRSLIEAGVRVQCIVTSPPYWGLRDYGMPGQLGMEPTIGDFIANMVEVFDLCKELLTDDGTLWLNMGDSYAGSRSGPDSGSTLEGSRRNQNAAKAARMSMVASRRRDDAIIPRSDRKVDGLKAKDLIGQPWRLAFALQEAGWWLRQDIIWHKPNPMPESVADRCTKAHEYLFLLTKSERYHFDQRAIAEPVATSTAVRVAQEIDQQTGSIRANGGAKKNGPMRAVGAAEIRNKRSVWSVPTARSAGAHFAVMPEALVIPCVLAGSRANDIVFDPFMGTGTVAHVAQQLGRRWLGAELNPEYLALQPDRTRQHGLALEAA